MKAISSMLRKWAFGRSASVYIFNGASCGGCYRLAAQALTANPSLQRANSMGDADIIAVCGAATARQKKSLSEAARAGEKTIISVGDCAAGNGPFSDCVNIISTRLAADKTINGCHPPLRDIGALLETAAIIAGDKN